MVGRRHDDVGVRCKWLVDRVGVGRRANHHRQIRQVVSQAPEQLFPVVHRKIQCRAFVAPNELNQQPREEIVPGTDHCHTELATGDALEMGHGLFGLLKLLNDDAA